MSPKKEREIDVEELVEKMDEWTAADLDNEWAREIENQENLNWVKFH